LADKVSLNGILKAIHDAGEAQIREVERRAQKQLDEVLSDIQARAEQAYEEALEAALSPAMGKRARILHHARLEALRIVGDVRESLVETALEQARGQLASMRLDARYPDVLRRLTEEAFEELGVSPEEIGRTRVEADRRDGELMEGILIDLGWDLLASYELDCWGGLIVRSEDGRVVIINSLEARLEQATPYLRRHLAAFLEDGLYETPVSRKKVVAEV
jgi:vacuolar-type H+-ATPase subunit E/Vma4